MEPAAFAKHSVVREQYEQLPYPQREANEERERLLATGGDALQYISHYGYGGTLQPDAQYRVLIAGGGTGDATIYWAEQLRNVGASVHHLDLSSASIDVAKQRAAIRGLDNITFTQGSLLDLPACGDMPYDFINCSGVLHHLPCPQAGLNALKSVLKPDGIINIMVYGYYRRELIYRMQSALRALCNKDDALSTRIDYAYATLEAVKHSDWGQMLHHQFGHEIARNGDSGLVDLYLHSQDRAYTIPQLYEWVESCGLALSQWVNNGESHYHTLFAMSDLKDEALRTRIASLPRREQEAFLEMLSGNIGKHQFYVSHHTLPVASPSDEAMVPDFSFFAPPEKMIPMLAGLTPEHDGKVITFESRGEKKSFKMNAMVRLLLQAIDGKHTVGEIIDQTYRTLAPSQSEAFERTHVQQAFQALYEAMHFGDWLLLRHSSVAQYPTLLELQRSAQASMR